MPRLFAPAIPAGRINGRSQPTLVTGDLTLRPWQADDASHVAAAFADSEIQRWLSRSIESEAEARTWIEERHSRWATESGVSWAIIDNASNQFLGQMRIWRINFLHGFLHGLAEFSCWIVPQNRGQGVAVRSRRSFSMGF